ncbi:MAG: FAD-dependent oxidoreductase [Chloroflexota bacterium]|nr:FAD-dependent oxidoreductase [Chloroflexota bacterium]
MVGGDADPVVRKDHEVEDGRKAASYDLVVIGAGGAGSTAAGEAIGRGAKVAMVERWKVGGTCLNVGCDPTKTMVRSAQILHLARHAERFGIQAAEVGADWPAVMRRVERVIDTIRGGDGDQNVRNSGVTLYKASATFRSSHEIDVDGQTIYGDKIIVATGARWIQPPIVGLAEVGYITNVEAVALPALPRSLAIIGGGVVAVEFAQIFARFGVEVTILGSADRLLPREDADLSHALQAILEREGIRVETGVRVRCAEFKDGLKCLGGDRGDDRFELCRAEEILVAAGRAPAVDGLNLEAAGVTYDPKQGITVDDELRTTTSHIWAIGDVVSQYAFTHVADYQARIAEHNAMSGRPPRRVDYRVVPWVTFTDPELARVGLTEQEARDAGYDVKVGVVPVKDLARAVTSGETDGLVKVIADGTTGEILGGHILAAHAGELLAEVALAMQARLPAAVIADTIHAYPTLSEGIFWAAYELAKPDEPTLDAIRGHQSPYGQVPADV